MGDRGIAGILSNSLMGVVVAVTIVLGVSKTAATATSALGLPAFEERTLLAASAVMSLVIAVPIARVVRQRRNLSSEEVP
jgi:hypothetical protein